MTLLPRCSCNEVLGRGDRDIDRGDAGDRTEHLPDRILYLVSSYECEGPVKTKAAGSPFSVPKIGRARYTDRDAGETCKGCNERGIDTP